MSNRFLNTTHRNVAWIRKAFLDDQLDIKPPFQRNPVWTERQRAYLIDSILRGYPIPELYMQETVDESGNQKYVIVDGQQRVRACLEFLEGKFALYEEDSKEWADLRFDDLSVDKKKQVWEYSFVVRVLPEMPEEELRLIFVRVNRNTVSLNPQELRHGTYWGPFIKTMEEIADHDFWATSGIFSANDFRRMLDVEYVSELAVAMLYGPLNKKQGLDEWYATYESHFEQKTSVTADFNKVLGEISQILPDLARTRWRKKSDFYTLFLVLAKHVDALPLSSDQRKGARQTLMEFAANVSELLHDFTRAKQFSREVIDYAENVVRSAADLQNRKRRADLLETVLDAVWQPPESDRQMALPIGEYGDNSEGGSED